MDVLYSLYYPRKDHSRFSENEFRELVCPMYQHDTVQLLGKIYDWSAVDANDIDADKYLLAKRFSEVIEVAREEERSLMLNLDGL